MNEADALEIVHRTITMVAIVSAPMVLAAMTAGIIVAICQALTQVQEMTLTFVPKIIALLLALSISSAFIGSTINSFTQFIYSRVETGF